MLIRGWSSTLGHDWSAVESQWNGGTNSQWLGTGFFGTSEIGSGIAGGWDGTNAYPSFVTYGAASGLTNPLVLNLVPPPHYATLSSASPTVEGFRLRIAVSGFRGSARIWSSTNAVDWSPLGSVDITSDAVEYLDTSTVAEQRFYRVQQ